MLTRRLLRGLKHSAKVACPLSNWDAHLLTGHAFPSQGEATAAQMLDFYRKMYTIRRLEVVADELYKQKLIRGFCHLADGQEAVAMGLEAELTHGDPFITAYRNHGNAYLRGIGLYPLFCELLGRRDGSSRGKGGSMHYYSSKSNYYGGNGIVGAQVPVGTGLAFALRYKGNTDNVSVVLYGDGAANQGQLYEAANMASVWKLPVIYVVENNRYAMGTSVERSSANGHNFHKNLPAVPGIRVDGFNVLEVAAATRFAKEFARKHGPIVMNVITYRYHGHSMSDPGTTYRKREEVADVRKNSDCIKVAAAMLLKSEVLTEAELESLHEEITAEVDREKDRALQCQEPSPSSLAEDVYSPGFNHFIRAPSYEDSVFVRQHLIE